MHIMKFGGRALKDSTAIKRVKELVLEAGEPIVVVVAALDGVTDKLYDAARSVLTDYDTTREIFTHLHSRHLKLIEELIPPASRSSLIAEIQVLFNDLEDILHGVNLVRQCSQGSIDLILCYGVRFSARILSYYLSLHADDCRWLDARKLILTYGTSAPGKAVVKVPETYERIRAQLRPQTKLCIVTGSVAADENGVTTGLGRKGADFTASLLGAALDAEYIDIWSDVDGIFTADPALVPDAPTIRHLTYEEAQELAYFEAAIIHPRPFNRQRKKKSLFAFATFTNPPPQAP